MITFPMKFEDMPHTEETEIVIRGAMHDMLHYEDYIEYLKTSQLFCVFDKNEFCGFYSEKQEKSVVEIHCFIYPSKRKIATHLMKFLRDDKKRKNLTITTSVFSNFKHVVRYLKFLGFKEVFVETGCAKVKGQIIDITYLTYEGTTNG